MMAIPIPRYLFDKMKTSLTITGYRKTLSMIFNIFSCIQLSIYYISNADFLNLIRIGPE